MPLPTIRYPSALDDDDNLYQPTNLATTRLTAPLSISETVSMEVEDTSMFPANGLVRVGFATDLPGETEFIHYTSRDATHFYGLTRGIDVDPMFPAIAHATNDDVGEEEDAQHHAAHTNAIKAVERTLGTNPQGAFATVADRLAACCGASSGGGGGVPIYYSYNNTTGGSGFTGISIWQENAAGTSFSSVYDPGVYVLRRFQIFGFSASDVWATAGYGSVLHWDGTSWSTVTSGLSASALVSAIWGSAANSVWFAADDGGDLKLYKWDGAAISLIQTIVGRNVFVSGVDDGAYALGSTQFHTRRMWGSSATNIVLLASHSDASGDQTVYRYNGSTWASDSLTVTASDGIYSVWGSSNDFWIGGAGKLYRNNGSGWAVHTTAAGVFFKSIWGSATNDIYAGNFALSTGQDLYHWDGASWAVSATGLGQGRVLSIFGLSATDMRLIRQNNSTSFLEYVKKTTTGWATEQVVTSSDDGPTVLWGGLTSGSGGGGGGGGSAGDCTWNEINQSQVLVGCTNYITNSGSQLQLTLPSTAPQGSVVKIAGKGTGGWKIIQQAGQAVIFDTDGPPQGQTTPGVTGSITPDDPYNYLELLCITPNTTWLAMAMRGSFSLT